MKWRNLILYLGLICLLAGVLTFLFAETNRSNYYGGVTLGWGVVITVIGWFFYQKRTIHPD